MFLKCFVDVSNQVSNNLTCIIIPYIPHILASGGLANKLRTPIQIYGLGFLEFDFTDHVVFVTIPHTKRRPRQRFLMKCKIPLLKMECKSPSG